MTSPPAGGIGFGGPTPAGLWSRTFVVLCLLGFCNGFATAPYQSLLPVYVEADLGRLPLFTAYLRSLTLILGGIFAIVGGRLADVLGLKTTLLLGLAGAGLTGFVFHTHAVVTLTLLILVIGAAAGPWSTAGQSYLIAAAGPSRLGLGGALYFLSGTAGNSVGAFCTGMVKQSWSFPRLGTTMALIMGGVFVAGLLLLPSTHVARAVDTPRERLALWASYRPLMTQRNVHLLMGLRLSITSFWGMATLVLPLLVYRASQSAATAAYYGAVSLAAAAACQLLTGLLRDRFGRTVPLIVSALGIVVSSAALALYTDSVPGLFIFGTALTATAWAVSTLVPALIAEVAEESEKNRLVGLGHMVWSGAMVIGSIIGGILVEVGPHLPFVLGVVHAAVGTLCIWRLCVRLDAHAR
ncbi:MAG: MFS transporter [Candidatus Latescibacterota bacterium]